MQRSPYSGAMGEGVDGRFISRLSDLRQLDLLVDLDHVLDRAV
jgi:hypothetical protein